MFDSSYKIRIKADTEKALTVWGEVYVPLAVDTDDDTMVAAEITKSAYDFMREGRNLKIDVQHDLEESGCCVVESFVARKGDPDFKANAWVLAVELYDPNLKEAARKGELNGFSFYSDDLKAVTISDVPITKVRKLAGTTEPSTDPSVSPHEHSLVLEFDSQSNVIPVFTSEDNDHRHFVDHTTATNAEQGHSHRLVY